MMILALLAAVEKGERVDDCIALAFSITRKRLRGILSIHLCLYRQHFQIDINEHEKQPLQ